MRITTVFRRLLGVTKMYVERVGFTIGGDLSVGVRPTWRLSRCGQCGRRARRYDRRPLRRWRHAAWSRSCVDLVYEPWRVDCHHCGVRVEQVPWADRASRFTYDFEELAAYLSQITDRTQVHRLLRISWQTVGSIVGRVVARRLDPERFLGLRRIGIDEFSYRKRHHYLTVVVDHDRRRVVWAGEGKSSEALAPFFELLGDERCREIEMVTIDLSAAFIKAVRERLPQAEIVFDRFHVQRLASDAVDEVRRSLVRELATDPEQARAVKGTRFVVLKNPWNLSRRQRSKLAEIQETNQRLYRAYLLKETLAKALDYRQPWRAERELNEWLSWASRSRLKPFVRLARTIRKHRDGILAYIKTRLTNGLVEGLNNKIRMIARRAYGFHSPQALIAMIFLNCGGIQLHPPLPTAI
jgi:transposase